MVFIDKVINTMKNVPDAEMWTHESWNTRVRRQIDFILIDEICFESLCNASALDCFASSDHRGVLASLFFARGDYRARNRNRIQVGWAPSLDTAGKPSAYHSALDDVVTSCRGGSIDPTEFIVQAARKTSAEKSRPSQSHSKDVEDLFEARRQEGDPILRKQLSRQLWRALRCQRRARMPTKLEALAKEGAGMKKLRLTQKQERGRLRMSNILDRNGDEKNDPDDVCEAFAAFYEDLYRSSEDNPLYGISEQSFETQVASEEVTAALKRLKKGKTGAEDGLVAEMLLTEHGSLVDTIACLFSNLLCDRLEHPGTCKMSKKIILFRRGDAREPKNYRPISIIPVMAKLFSAVLCGRIQALVEDELDEEQYGFRKGRGCSDAVHVVRTVIEKSAEWGEELWIATLDVEKAFDIVHHPVLFDALAEIGIDASVAATLRRLYKNMKATVALGTGAVSREFPIDRGVRQGDPLSPLLFNQVLNGVLAEITPAWSRRGYGTNVVREMSGNRLTHVMFADDMTLIARCWTSMK